MRQLMMAFAFLSCSWQANAELNAEIVEFGYYQPAGELERERNYNTATGYVRTGTDVHLVEQTTQIPMALGRLFGFKFRIRGFPRDQVTANLELEVSHPQIQRPNGTTLSGYRIPVVMDIVGGKIENQTGYKFDKEYELVAGEWSFKYWHNDQLLLEQTFTIYDPVTAGVAQPSDIPLTPSDAVSTTPAATAQTPGISPQVDPEQP